MAEPLASGEKRRVLIVDADPTFGESLLGDFEARAFIVDNAVDIEQAIACVAAALPDLAVVDLYLPHDAALALLRLWRVQHPTMVVILVSGRASLNLVVDLLKEGARRFFTKPVSAATLVGELEQRPAAPPSAGSPAPPNHRLGRGALSAEGVDRFFTISPGLLSIAGFDGYFKQLNSAWEKALGFTIDELCDQPYLELVHPDDRAKARDEALELRGGETVFHFKNRYRCKDGGYRWLAWSATPSPEHELIYASARDVTRSVRMEEGLRQTNARLKEVVASSALQLRDSTVENDALVELGRFKDEMAAMIVHDLKNPLAVIVSNYDYILEGFEGPDDCLEALQDSQNAGRRMLRLLANLIDVERLENGTLEVSPAQISLSLTLSNIVEQRRVLARSRRISLLLAPAPDVALIADVDLLTRTVENIFDNALRHTPGGGFIEVELREVGADVEIRIGNSGVAIPPAARAILFDKYQQGTHEVGRMNLGLGLYFCRLAIETLGGSIWIEETERLPTVFAIRLPRARALAQPRSATHSAQVTA